MKRNKKLLGLLLVMSVTACGQTGGTTTTENQPTNTSTTPQATTEPIQEGTLEIHNVVQYLGYNSVEIRKYMDGVEEKGLELYYYIVDDTICTIENDQVI